MKNAKINKFYILVIFPILTLFILAQNQEVSAASAVAFDSVNGVISQPKYNFRTRRAAENAAIISCRKRGGRSCRIIVSCSGDGYGMIYLRRFPGRPIQAVGASCGKSTVREAIETARWACRRQGRGQCGGPKGSWYDSAQARIINNRRQLRYNRRINTRNYPRYSPQNNRNRNTRYTSAPAFSNFTTRIRSLTIPGRGGLAEANFRWRAYGGASHLKIYVQVRSNVTYRKWTNVLSNQSPVDIGSWTVRGVPGERFHFRAVARDSRGRMAYSRIISF